MIRYTAEQLLQVNRSMTLVPTIFYMRPEGNPGFRFHKLNVLNENLKRVYLTARPITSGMQQSPGRNGWVILLETVAGNGMSIELNQIDSEGNTIVMVRPRSIKLVDQSFSFHHGQVSGFVYSKVAELTMNLDVRSFFTRVEGFGLSRYKLDKIPSCNDTDLLFDYRGHRFWVWSVLRILEPELPSFIPDYNESPLVSIMAFNAPSTKADWVRSGHFLPQKQKRQTTGDNRPSCHHQAPTTAPRQNITENCFTPSSLEFSDLVAQDLQELDFQGNLSTANILEAAGFPVHHHQASHHQPSADVPVHRHASTARDLAYVIPQVQRYLTAQASNLNKCLINAPGMGEVAEEEEDGSEENSNPVWLRSDDDVGAFSRFVAFSESCDEL